MLRNSFLAIIAALLLISCSDASSQTPGAQEDQAEALPRPAPTTRVLPTIYPTATPLPSAVPTETRVPEPTEVPDTPVAFDQVVVDLRYRIPGLGLERRLIGNVSGLIEIIDDATGKVEERRNQPGVLFDLQQALPELSLAEPPEDCELCVLLQYELPLAEESDAGWLQDTQMLASLENYTVAALGPHFPEGTVVGLRRSATPYQVAHYVAITDDGQLYRWTAIDDELSGPEPAVELTAPLAEALETADLPSLLDDYGSECPQGTGVESLTVRLDDFEKQIQIICPELSMPAKLLPAYLLLDELAAEMLSGQGLPSPQPAMPVSSLLYFARDDGARLNLWTDGLAVAIDGDGITYTETITASLAVSLTTSLVDSGGLGPGVDPLVVGETESILVVRDSDGLYSAGWNGPPAPALAALVDRLGQLLDELLGLLAPRPEEEGTATPSATGTPSAEATPEPTPTR